MTRNNILFFAAILLAFGCSKPDAGLLSLSDNPVSSKIINPGVDALDNGVIVCLSSADAVHALAATGKYVISPVFPCSAGNEALEKKYGLDRWFKVMSSDTDTRTLAEELAEIDAVESIEFNAVHKRPSEASGFAIEVPMTRSETAMQPATMNDPLFKSQWYLHNSGNKEMFGQSTVAGTDVGIKEAWKLESGDPRIIVAVVDEGIKYTHPDLAGAMWVNSDEIPGNGMDDDDNGYIDDIHGYNFVADGPVSWDLYGDTGHGTHVAGLVGAVNNNGIGISSVAGGSGNGDGVRLMSCQIYSGATPENTAAYAAAIKYAADNGASVLQCSWGEPSGRYASDAAFEQGLSVIKLALDYFRDPLKANCPAVDRNIVVFSAGNEWEPMACYPGAYRDYICVSAISQDNLPAWYTNYGKGVNIAAPGGDNTLGLTILSTVPDETDTAQGDYAFMHGTSQATPIVSGIVALGLSYAMKLGRSYKEEDFKSLVLTSVNPLDAYLEGTKTMPSGTLIQMSDYKGRMGTGIIDAWKLLMNIEGVPFVTVKTGSEAVINLKEWFGDDAPYLTWKGTEAAGNDVEALGISLAEISSDGNLHIRCDRTGCGKITVRAIAGGDAEGTAAQPGGMAVSRTIAIVSRHNVCTNGGWL